MAAGNDPRPIAVIDTVIRKETPCRLIGGPADDEASGTGQDFVMAVGADDLERQRIIAGHRDPPIDLWKQKKNITFGMSRRLAR
jgi:hypothetical protein